MGDPTRGTAVLSRFDPGTNLRWCNGWNGVRRHGNRECVVKVMSAAVVEIYVGWVFCTDMIPGVDFYVVSVLSIGTMTFENRPALLQ
jgi:hypothetical protein